MTEPMNCPKCGSEITVDDYLYDRYNYSNPKDWLSPLDGCDTWIHCPNCNYEEMIRSVRDGHEGKVKP